ncbi:MAG: restriction endonuclease [Chloroflexota bacterium]
MALTQAQKALVERAKAAGSGILGTGLSDDDGVFLISVIMHDLGLSNEFPEIRDITPSFFESVETNHSYTTGLEFEALIEKLFVLQPDADTYFMCLATLYKSRRKYARILENQPIPTMDQVGPRALLQYGQMSSDVLAGWILWRKWIFDIDNRAGQETGYLFEPIIASAIGGVPFSARTSPVRRRNDNSKGRQVDCIRQQQAYEIKIRVTIASSGQGRWQEELDFPADCRESGYEPILLVLDPTPNPKLKELVSAFEVEGGRAYIGEHAWAHLEKAAGDVMSQFLSKYVRAPISQVLQESSTDLPDLKLQMNMGTFSIIINDEIIEFERKSPS